MTRKSIRLLLILMVSFLAGCVAGGKIASHMPVDQGFAFVELEEVPFFPQQKDQCGPAALATVLAAAGVKVTPAELVGKVFLPGRRGSLQLEMVAATRRYGRIPCVLEVGSESLLAELQAGRPVLVLQNLGLSWWPIWHYAVVIGFDTARDVFFLRSGVTERLSLSAGIFYKTLEASEFWAMVALRPGEIPARPEHDHYLGILAAMDPFRYPDLLLPAYRAAHQQWPESTMAVLGLGNAEYAAGHPAAAIRTFRTFLENHPSEGAIRNNLAEVLMNLGDYQEALFQMNKALSMADRNDPLYPTLIKTRQEVLLRLATLPRTE